MCNTNSTHSVEMDIMVAQKLVQSLSELNSGSELESELHSGLDCEESLASVPLLSTLLTSAPLDSGSGTNALISS